MTEPTGPQGIEPLAEFITTRLAGDRNKGLFWAACRAAEDGLDPAPLLDAAMQVGLTREAATSTIASATRTIASARRDHKPLSAPTS